MRKLYYVLFFLLIATLTWSCQRRALENETGDLARVPIHIDWSQSGLDVAKAHNVSIWFFPHDGSPSFEYRYEGNLTDMEAQLPEGAYAIVVFNETVDTDWTSLQFEGSNRYETFRVSARPDQFRGLSTKGDETDVRKSPDALASWSMDKFEVSPEMIRATAMGSRIDDPGQSGRIDVTLKPLTKGVKIKAYVQNLVSAKLCSGTMTGAVGGVMLATGDVSVGDVSHMFIMNNRIYDQENPNNGYIHANILVFNAANDAKNILTIDFELKDGKTASPDPFNITETVNKDEQEVVVEVGAGVEGGEEDHPIILPEVTVEGDVSVDDWENQNIPIN